LHKKIQLENVDLSAFFFISNSFSELENGGFKIDKSLCKALVCALCPACPFSLRYTTPTATLGLYRRIFKKYPSSTIHP
ncbi:hypothetical protein, partial [Streptococcus agalactiae]